jgi:soluble lytic murein transglycosylase-like protein
MRWRLLGIAASAMTLCAAPKAAAGGAILRCTQNDGTVVYTNVPPTGFKGRCTATKTTFTKPPTVYDKADMRKRTPSELDPYIEDAASRYNVPASLVRAIMHAESNYQKTALSPKGASGLMQLMPATATEMYVKDIFDAKQNIEGGTRYLRVLANLYNGDMVKMIAAYNAGPEAVRKYGGKVPPYAETQAYVKKVVKLYFQYKARADLLSAEEP